MNASGYSKVWLLGIGTLAFCHAAFGTSSDGTSTGRTFSGVASEFELLDTVVHSEEPIKIRVTLRNQSASPVDFRYIGGSFIEHIRIFDAQHRQIPVRLNAPFLESGVDKVSLQPGEQTVNVVTVDVWQLYDLKPGSYELHFYYDLRLIGDERLAAASMQHYQSKDWVVWDMKRYPFTVVDEDASASRDVDKKTGRQSRKETTGLESMALASKVHSAGRVKESDYLALVENVADTTAFNRTAAKRKKPSRKFRFRFSQCSVSASGELKLKLILVNTSYVPQKLSKVNKISLKCEVGLPGNKLPDRYIRITRPLDPKVAALKLKRNNRASQEITFRPELRAGQVAEINASCKIAGVTYKSNTINIACR